jgi:hypothetical protein
MVRLLSFLFVVVISESFAQNKILKISSDMEVRSMFEGKSMATKGVVNIDLANQKTVTKITHPITIVSIQEKSGDVFNYDATRNEVTQRKSQATMSSENIFKYMLLQNQMDLGLKERGFKLTNSKFNEGLVILTWEPPTILASKISYAELVMQNNIPIYLANFDTKKKMINKSYYTKYQTLNGKSVPLQVTDFQYIYSDKNKKDSIITKTTFSNIKLNNEVDMEMLNFKIPSNAKVILE